MPYKDVVKETVKPNNGVKQRTRDILISTKREATKAARDLGYKDDILKRINNAETISEIGNIMNTARRNMYND